jgi:hypothetical protein
MGIMDNVDPDGHEGKVLANAVKRVEGVPDHEVDLSKASLFADSSRGVYIPQYFAENVRREYVSGVSDEDYATLKAGPDHEHYWDAWADVLDNAKIMEPKVGECYLHQDGDLWVVPVEKEEEVPMTVPAKVVLGHEFREMARLDYMGFSGADEGSYICYLDDQKTTLILSPNGELSEIVLCSPHPGWRIKTETGNSRSCCYAAPDEVRTIGERNDLHFSRARWDQHVRYHAARSGGARNWGDPLMVARRKAADAPRILVVDVPQPTYGRGFFRMKERLGPERAEELRQEVLRDQIAAREKWGGQAVLPRDRDTYKEYPKSKRSKRRKK